MSDDKIKEEPKEPTRDEIAAAWEDHIRAAVNERLDIFLPEAVHANEGVQYIHPITHVDPKSGKNVEDKSKAKAAVIMLEFIFAKPIEFVDKPPKGVKKPKK